MANDRDDMTYEELVDHITQQAHLGLLEGGGQGLKSAIYLWVGQAIQWGEAQGK